jgi:hypothetical protein
VLFDAADKGFIPKPLGGASWYLVTDEQSYDRLYRRLTGQQEVTKPTSGDVCERPVRDRGNWVAARKNTIWHVPHSCNPFFTGREAILEELLDGGEEALGETLAAAVGDKLERVALLRAVVRYSLLDRDPEAHALSIHWMVQAVLRDGMDEDVRRLWAERVVGG